jgi:hypothetical protein
VKRTKAIQGATNMMDQHEQEVRLAAEEAFVESLHQLEERLMSDEGRPPLKSSLTMPNLQNLSVHRPAPASPPPSQQNSCKLPTEDDLKAFADAAEEIEQFMQTRH